MRTSTIRAGRAGSRSRPTTCPGSRRIVSELGEDKGLKLFRDIVQINGLSPRKGHTLLANMVAAGEVPLALTVFSYKSDQSSAPARRSAPSICRR